jgi:hypothetical protein
LTHGKTFTLAGIVSGDNVELTFTFVNVLNGGSSTDGFVSGSARVVNNGSYSFYTTRAGSATATLSSYVGGVDGDNYEITGTARAG